MLIISQRSLLIASYFYFGVITAAVICGTVSGSAESTSQPSTITTTGFTTEQALDFTKDWLRDFREGNGSRAIKQSFDCDVVARKIIGDQFELLSLKQREEAGRHLLAIICLNLDNSLARRAMSQSSFDEFSVRTKGETEFEVSYRVTFPNRARNSMGLILARGANDSIWKVRDLSLNQESLVEKLRRDYETRGDKKRPVAYLESLHATMAQQHKQDASDAGMELPVRSNGDAEPPNQKN